jgi:uncharacterized protein
MSESATEETIVFCRALREHGLAVTPAESIDAARTLKLIDLEDRREAFLSLRSLLTSRAEDFPLFEELFDSFWNRIDGRDAAQKGRARQSNSTGKSTRRVFPTTPASKGLAYFLQHQTGVSSGETESLKVPGASNIASSSQKDFSVFGSEELQEISRLARRIVKRLARDRSRRWKPVRRGPRIHLRRTLRQSLTTGGELATLSFKQRRRKKTRLVVICDVSGSMDIYSRLLLQFVYGLQNSFARTESFVFSTTLERITGHLRNRTYETALERLAGDTPGWSGGTLIGPSIAAFNSKWPELVDKRTIVIILSDGWDTGPPELLASSLGELSSRAARLIWLNPLLGNAAYRPLTRGMQAALPYIDVFAPAHNLASLRALERHLSL